VKVWAGHSGLGTTSRYTHFRGDYRQQVVNDLGYFLALLVLKMQILPSFRMLRLERMHGKLLDGWS
jgi:hypothetical protein